MKPQRSTSISAAQLKADAIACLKAGPPQWIEAGKALSLEIRWLYSQARERTDTSNIVAEFSAKFVPKPIPYPEWPDLAKVVEQAFDLLWCQHLRHQEWESILKDDDIREAFPAREIVVALVDETPTDWKAKWSAAGGKNSQGRCVAHNLSAVWRKFSDFGQPYEPFDWSGALSTTDIEADEAKALGVATGDSLDDLIADYAQRIGAGDKIKKQTEQIKPREPDEMLAAQQKSGCAAVLVVGFIISVSAITYALVG